MEDQIPGQMSIYDILPTNRPTGATESRRIIDWLTQHRANAWADAYEERYGVRPPPALVRRIFELATTRDPEK